MNIALAALTTAVLAVPTGTASAARGKSTTRLSAAITHATTRVGTPVRLSGSLTPALGNKRVYLQRFTSHHWNAAGDTRTTRSGKFAFAIRPATAGTYTYRVTYRGDSAHKAATSPTRRLTAIKAATGLSAGFTAASVHPGVPTTFTGALSPGLPGRRVDLQRYSAGRWTKVTSALTSRSSRYAFTLTSAVPSTFKYRASYGGARDAQATTSPFRTLVVLPAASLNSARLLGGTINPVPPVGPANRVSVVTRGTFDKDDYFADLPVIVRNTMPTARTDVEVTALARNSAGKLVGTGTADLSSPLVLGSGGAAIARVDFDDADAIPDDATFTFTVTSNPISADRSLSQVTMKVTEANNTGASVVGTASNVSGAQMSGPYRIDLYCFAGSRLTEGKFTYADSYADIPRGGTLAFGVELDGMSCDDYLVAVTGFNF